MLQRISVPGTAATGWNGGSNLPLLANAPGKVYPISMARRGNTAGPIIKGLFFVVLAGIFISRGSWGWSRFFPLLFIGFILVFGNVFNSLRTRNLRERNESEREEEDEKLLEKHVLKAARKNNGMLTPALVALDSPLSIEQAETILQSFVKRGYATMEVSESGQLEYRFAEFLPPGDTTGK